MFSYFTWHDAHWLASYCTSNSFLLNVKGHSIVVLFSSYGLWIDACHIVGSQRAFSSNGTLCILLLVSFCEELFDLLFMVLVFCLSNCFLWTELLVFLHDIYLWLGFLNLHLSSLHFSFMNVEIWFSQQNWVKRLLYLILYSWCLCKTAASTCLCWGLCYFPLFNVCTRVKQLPRKLHIV